MTKPKIVLGLTGSVASTLAPKTIKALQEVGEVSVVFTESARAFLKMEEIYSLVGFEERLKKILFPGIFDEEAEWGWPCPNICQLPNATWHKGDSVLHIELRKWADVLVIAPLSANTLAKMANGISDNLLTSVIRAWDFHKPIVVAPAMNTLMWSDPITQKHIQQFGDFLISPETRKFTSTFSTIHPASKVLACGDEGEGAMGDISKIVKATRQALGKE